MGILVGRRLIANNETEISSGKHKAGMPPLPLGNWMDIDTL
jgi:hypothetical protein